MRGNLKSVYLIMSTIIEKKKSIKLYNKSCDTNQKCWANYNSNINGRQKSYY